MKESTIGIRELRLWVLLGQARDLIRTAIRREVTEHNVTVRQVAVMMAVSAHPEGISQIKIAEQLYRQPHTISNIVRRMEEAGLLKRTRDSNKKRIKNVTLTEYGEKIYKQTEERKSIHKIFSCLSEAEAEQLAFLLGKIKRKGMEELDIKRDTFLSP